MKKTKFLVLMGLLLSVFYACKKDNSEVVTPPPPDLTPVVLGISPTSGGYNSTLTISGKNFSSIASNNTVTIGGVTVPVATATDSLLTITVPQLLSTGGGPVVVGTSHGKDTGAVFSYAPDIYVVGRERGTDNIFRPKLWLNGNPTVLSSGPSGGGANAVFVTTNNVLVGGYEETNSTSEPRVWFNGTVSSLPHLGNGGYINSVFLNGSTIYAAGVDHGTSNWSLARTWVNSTGSNLTPGTATDAMAKDMVVVGSDQYVCGSEVIGGRNVARVWRNGVPTTLSNSSNHCYAVGITADGSDIYVVGYESLPSGDRVKVWRNGVETTYAGDADWRERPNSITVYKGVVLVAGFEEGMMNGMIRAKYWIDGLAYLVEPNAYGRAIKVLACGENFYVLANTNLQSNPRIKVFHNGNPIDITSGATDSYPTGMALR